MERKHEYLKARIVIMLLNGTFSKAVLVYCLWLFLMLLYVVDTPRDVFINYGTLNVIELFCSVVDVIDKAIFNANKCMNVISYYEKASNKIN